MEAMTLHLLTQADIAHRCGVTRQRAAEVVAKPGFPKPFAFYGSARHPLWKLNQFERWLEAWERKSGRPKKGASR
jgi:hypothetical protein